MAQSAWTCGVGRLQSARDRHPGSPADWLLHWLLHDCFSHCPNIHPLLLLRLLLHGSAWALMIPATADKEQGLNASASRHYPATATAIAAGQSKAQHARCTCQAHWQPLTQSTASTAVTTAAPGGEGRWLSTMNSGAKGHSEYDEDNSHLSHPHDAAATVQKHNLVLHASCGTHAASWAAACSCFCNCSLTLPLVLPVECIPVPAARRYLQGRA
jgi:hypothetical protein